MELSGREDELLGGYLTRFTAVARDQRTVALLAATIHGIIGSESLICTRIAAFSPSAGYRPV